MMGFKFKIKNPIKSFSDSIERIGSNPLEGIADLGLKSVTGGQVGTDDITQRDREEEAKQDEKKRQAQIAASLSAGKQQGLDLAKLGYGQGLGEVGSDIQRVKNLQRQRTEGSDPVSQAIRNAKGGSMASAQRQMAASGVKGGVAAGALDEIARKQDSEIAASLYGQQARNIASERSLASNMLSGTTSLMFGSEGQANAANMPKAPEAGGMMGTVICTELYRQGYMDIVTYVKDSEYGRLVLRDTPHVMIGYQFLATPIVKLMRKSTLFTKIISYPALKWARHIAEEENSIIGILAVNVGQPICGIVGKLLSYVSGAKYV